MLKKVSIELNKTYRTDFGNLTGLILFNWINNQNNFSKSLDILSTYASCKNSLNVRVERNSTPSIPTYQRSIEAAR